MKVYTEIEACRIAVQQAQQNGKTVGLVTTMGAFHKGHLLLIRTSRQQCDVTAVTIFVNPTQFSPNDDFDAYPRTLEKDLQACDQEGVDIVFTPTVETMYGLNAKSSVHVGGLTQGLCGAHRPSHFDGVTTVVAKLFNILPADQAYFGEKDYQQMVVIRQMVRDLNSPIEIVPCPTVREPDGLAVSSRNACLTDKQRKQATSLYRALSTARDRMRNGETKTADLVESIRQEITSSGPADIEYIEIVDADSLEPLTAVDRPARICLAVRIGSCRLIDNIGVDV